MTDRTKAIIVQLHSIFTWKNYKKDISASEFYYLFFFMIQVDYVEIYDQETK